MLPAVLLNPVDAWFAPGGAARVPGSFPAFSASRISGGTSSGSLTVAAEGSSPSPTKDATCCWA